MIVKLTGLAHIKETSIFCEVPTIFNPRVLVDSPSHFYPLRDWFAYSHSILYILTHA